MPPYEGVTGKTSFKPDGDVSKEIFLLGVRNGQFVELARLNPDLTEAPASPGAEVQTGALPAPIARGEKAQ
jgi:hypothetical protein